MFLDKMEVHIILGNIRSRMQNIELSTQISVDKIPNEISRITIYELFRFIN